VKNFLRGVALTMFASTATAPLQAGTLEITPILMDVMTETNAATSLRIRNRGLEPARVQVRLQRWQQINGEVILTAPVEGHVAVSPPFMTLTPGVEYVVRVARIATAPVVGEESYRLLLDELPAPALPDGQVRLAVRHSIPVFFRALKASAGRVSWRLVRENGVTALIATNAGDRRVRIADLSFYQTISGRDTPVVPGLAGYVLGHSAMRWVVRDGDTSSTVAFMSETGAERASIAISGPSGAPPAPAPHVNF
jgi:fimbrial chaperone protein